jgi:hypothetical protein
MRTPIVAFIFLLLALSTPALAADDKKADAPPPPPPESKKTVDAFLGKWALDGSLTPNGAKEPFKLKGTMECKKAAGGLAVNCTMTAKAPAPIGTMELAALFGYDASRKEVHMFSMTSAGEVHDHKGTWKDDKTLDLGTLNYTEGGKPATETLVFTWADPKTLTFKSVTTGEQASTFDGAAKRK